MRADRYRWLARGFAVAAVLLSATVAARAQEATPNDSSSHDTILVQGLKTEALKKAIGTYVNALTVMDASEPVARYAPGTFCSAVLGLNDTLDGQPDFEAVLSKRVRNVIA